MIAHLIAPASATHSVSGRHDRAAHEQIRGLHAEFTAEPRTRRIPCAGGARAALGWSWPPQDKASSRAAHVRDHASPTGGPGGFVGIAGDVD